MKKTLLMLAAVVALGAAGPSRAADAVVGSGFLPDYSRLAPVDGRDGLWRYLDTSRAADIRAYRKVYLHPVEVVIASDGAYKAVRPDVLNRMAQGFRDALAAALKSGYEVVDAPMPDALGVRVALTGVQPIRAPRGVTDLLPIKMVFNLGRAVTGTTPKVAEASAEMEVLDGQGVQVAAVVSTRASDKTLPQAEQVSWDDVSLIVTAWSQQFRQGLDQARGVSPAPSN